ncbi:hypothetical protein Tco_1150990 [Tanacetum coccineum]
MAVESTVPQLVDKKGGSYAAIAPKLEPKKFNKWKNRMLCYLAGMEPYYIKCIKDGIFQPKTAKGAIKPEIQWTLDERRVVVQDQHLKSIIMSCLPDDIIELVISCETAKATWTDLVHSFEDIHERFVYEENLIQRRYDTKKALITTPSNERSTEEYLRDLNIEFHERALLENSKCFIKRRNNFSSQKANENNKCFKCGKKCHFAKDFLSKTSEPSYKSSVSGLSSKGFQPKFTPKLIQFSQSSSSQVDPKIQKDYKVEYKKMKAKLALLEASPSTSQTPKTFQPKNTGLVTETFDWYEEDVSDDEEVIEVKVLMALADDKLTVERIMLAMFVEEQRLNLLSKYNKIIFQLNKCKDELLILKQAKLDAVTFQIQNTKLTKLNHALHEQLKEEKKINEKWLTSSKKVNQCISEQIPHQKKKVLGGELLTESSSKMNENENIFVPASMGYDHGMVPKSKE